MAGLLVVGLGLAPGAAAGAQSGEHVCGDCHTPHPTSSAYLQRTGHSQLANQAPGLDAAGIRCLQCHGTPADRSLAVSSRPVPTVGALYLGPTLSDDHDLGQEIQCTSCHDPHRPELVTEQSISQEITCVSCHDAGEFAPQGHLSTVCGSCHRLHNGPGSLLREADPDFLCGACHEGVGPTPVNPGIDPVTGPPGHTEPQSGRCVECHRVH